MLKKIYAVKDTTLLILYLDHLISCRLKICKDINEYTSKIKQYYQIINRVVEKNVPMPEWVVINILLRNLTNSYD